MTGPDDTRPEDTRPEDTRPDDTRPDDSAGCLLTGAPRHGVLLVAATVGDVPVEAEQRLSPRARPYSAGATYGDDFCLPSAGLGRGHAVFRSDDSGWAVALPPRAQLRLQGPTPAPSREARWIPLHPGAKGTLTLGVAALHFRCLSPSAAAAAGHPRRRPAAGRAPRSLLLPCLVASAFFQTALLAGAARHPTLLPHPDPPPQTVRVSHQVDLPEPVRRALRPPREPPTPAPRPRPKAPPKPRPRRSTRPQSPPRAPAPPPKPHGRPRSRPRSPGRQPPAATRRTGSVAALRSPPPTRLAADTRHVAGVALRVFIPSSPHALQSHLRRGGGCLLVSRLHSNAAEALASLRLADGRAHLIPPRPCQGVPRILRDPTLNAALGDPLGQIRTQLAARGQPTTNLVLQAILSPTLDTAARAALHRHYGPGTDAQVAQRANAAGHSLRCYAHTNGSLTCS